MPVVIFHGDHTAVLDSKIDEMRKSYPAEAVERISMKNESFEQLLIRFAMPNFFNEQRLMIIEDCDEKKIDVSKIQIDKDLTVVFVFGKELIATSPILKWAEQNKFRTLGLSQPQDKRIFTFLDLLAEKNNKALTMLDELIDDFGGVYLLTMLIFLLRRLVLPIGKVPSFIETKLKNQKKNYSEKSLRVLYEEVLKTDFQLKTGKVDERSGLLLLTIQFLKK